MKEKLVQILPGGNAVEKAKDLFKKLLRTSQLYRGFSTKVHAMYVHINYIGHRFKNRHLCFEGKGSMIHILWAQTLEKFRDEAVALKH